MNVFILNTGRCGSLTFIQACRHIQNFTSAHESRSGLLGEERLNYPRDHIEADNRLSWLLGRLDDRFGDNAIYIHLRRDRIATAMSFTKRYSEGIIRAYRGDGILMGASRSLDPLDVAIDYCLTVERNIELFLKDKTHKIEVHLTSVREDFTRYWELIGAQGNLNAALSEFDMHYNASGPDGKSMTLESFTPRALNKLKRLVVNFPDYVR